jgi:dihydrofolate reductase
LLIKLIAITDADFGISKGGKVPWQFKDDLKFFKKQTENSVVMMGRNTFFSIPNAPLKQRINCVISKTLGSIAGVEVFESIESAVRKYPSCWIIGGAELYNYSLQKKLVKYALITQVHKRFCADTFIDESLLNDFIKNVIIKNKTYSIYEYIFPATVL